ncbi:hypothetical protein C8J55DRAFT_561922 [Lentinula edodes]|uniref:Uncharacterized protein n=1 Tax=Lentinula lateritia TaxID=40482 RepID=A0A9W9A826_9AGAR|nr:hypothetical protein C8J55DRAFT_561922 [Lentinula edodes]
MDHQGMPSSYGPQSTSGYNLRPSRGNRNTSGRTRSYSHQSRASYNYSTHGDNVENEFIEDRTPGFSLPSDFFRAPVGALKFEWFGEYPDTDEDVFHVQMPLPDGTEWKIRIFPSGRTNMSIFGYFLQPGVRLALGGPPVESWEQRFKGCLNLNLPPVITNEKWYFKEGQKVAICKNEEAVGEITIPVNAERERERQRQRNNGRSVRFFPLTQGGFPITGHSGGRSGGSHSSGSRLGGGHSVGGRLGGSRLGGGR